MTSAALAKALKEAIENAAAGEKVLSIYLFGIGHAAELKGHNLYDLAELAGTRRAYGTELSKAVKLAPHVILKAR